MAGSPAGIFLTARGEDYQLRIPKCNKLFNIYNPSDPVSYLIEPLIDSGFSSLATALVPHIPDTTQQLKGAVARGSKSLFSYYKSTTTFTKDSSSSPSLFSPLSNNVTTPEVAQLISFTEEAFSIATDSNGELPDISKSTLLDDTEDGAGIEKMLSSALDKVHTIENDGGDAGGVVVEQVTVEKVADGEKVTVEKVNVEKGVASPIVTNNPTSPTFASPSPTSPNFTGPISNQFFEGARFDYRMQPSGIVENLSEYAALINAHRCYWYSKDVMLFVLSHL